MTAPLYLADADPEAFRTSERIVLDGDEGRHAAVVRRIAAGEIVELTDGTGHVARCLVVAADKHGITCDVTERIDVPAPQPRVVVAQALPKQDRGEIAVETMTEVGVDAIVPWSATRCMVRWKGERGDKSLRRWRSTAREAAKQARRAWLPGVTAPVTTNELADVVRGASLGVVLHEEADRRIGELDVPPAGDVVIVVGPEGGVTPDEIETLEQAGAVTVRLGPTVLRTSTAGTVAAGVLLAATHRWR